MGPARCGATPIFATAICHHTRPINCTYPPDYRESLVIIGSYSCILNPPCPPLVVSVALGGPWGPHQVARRGGSRWARDASSPVGHVFTLKTVNTAIHCPSQTLRVRVCICFQSVFERVLAVVNCSLTESQKRQSQIYFIKNRHPKFTMQR